MWYKVNRIRRPDFKDYACVLSHVEFFVTLWTIGHQAPLSMGFPRQEYWSGLPFPPPGDLPNPGIKPGSPALQLDSLPAELQGSLCHRWFYQKFKEDSIFVFLKLLQNTEENKTLTHLVGPTSPKGWYQRQSTKMKIIGEYLLWHLNRWLNGKEFKYQCKR